MNADLFLNEKQNKQPLLRRVKTTVVSLQLLFYYFFMRNNWNQRKITTFTPGQVTSARFKLSLTERVN